MTEEGSGADEGRPTAGERTVTVSAAVGAELVRRSMVGAGLGDEAAAEVAEHLVDASLRGFDTYGIARVIELAGAVRERARQPLAIVRQSAGTALVDGGNNIGYVVGRAVADLGIDKALRSGVSIVGAHNTYFTGLLGYYCELAARHGLVSIATSSNEPLVAPFGAREARLGTNPIAIGFPNGDHPIIWDIGTSAVMRGDLWIRARGGEPLAAGLAIDAQGAPTSDAAAALQGSILAWGGHRGSGLSTMIQLFGLLAGAPDPGPRRVGSNAGLLFITIDPSQLSGPEDLAARTARFADYLRSAATVDGSTVRLPFERSQRERERRLVDGLMISAGLHAELVALAATDNH